MLLTQEPLLSRPGIPLEEPIPSRWPSSCKRQNAGHRSAVRPRDKPTSSRYLPVDMCHTLCMLQLIESKANESILSSLWLVSLAASPLPPPNKNLVDQPTCPLLRGTCRTIPALSRALRTVFFWGGQGVVADNGVSQTMASAPPLTPSKRLLKLQLRFEALF